MKKLFLPLFLMPLLTSAQMAYDIEEGRPTEVNGIEYGFEIRNERKKDVKDETFNRFEITVYAINKSGCTKLMFPRQTVFGTEYQEIIAQYDCLNATGKRLTSKSGTVRAKEFSVPYTTTIRNSEGKDIANTIRVRAGNVFRNGESITENFIVIIPDGERPKMKVRVKEIIE